MSSFYRHTGKRLFDLLITLPALILLSPLLGILALLVRVKLGPPSSSASSGPVCTASLSSWSSSAP